MAKILTIVGARPQFIKAAAVSRELRKTNEEILIHTGQHYDSNMSDIFFEELNIPKPDVNLGIGSGSHGEQTAKMIIELEKVMLKEKPDYVLVYGDTNSTLAAALAGIKIHIPVIHVEAGLRSFNMNMPEEINRILTDRISTFLFCPTTDAVNNLKNEGLTNNVYNIGDVMCDAVLFYSQKLDKVSKDEYFSHLKGVGQSKVELLNDWYIATIHRAENTDSKDKIKEILLAFEKLDEKVIFPVHPRTLPLVKEILKENNFSNTLIIEPMGYLDMLYFTKNAKKAITDSGGLQKETYILSTPCVTVRDQTEWVETLIGNFNVLAKPNAKDIVDKVMNTKIDESKRLDYYGKGDAAKKLCEIINKQ